MVWSLFLLVLTGQCSSFTCQLYEYYFINENMNWDEAREHCRDHYTDLATVNNMEDVERLLDKKDPDEAWIGLRSNSSRGAGEWRWSQPGLSFNNRSAKWNKDEPNDRKPPENCVRINTDKKTWADISCDEKYHFVCFNETTNQTYHLSEEKKTWKEAQKICREKHTDLISGLDQFSKAMKTIKKSSNENIWIGLFRDRWRWADGRNSSFRNWNLEKFEDKEESGECAIMLKGGKWSSAQCTKEKPFFCYEDKVILIQENKTWPEALNHCRTHHRDLVSITDRHQQRWVEKKVENATTTFVWVGLRYTCTLDFWFWISDEKVSYENWSSERTEDDCDMSAAMERGGENKWFTKNDDEKFNFLCSVC